MTTQNHIGYRRGLLDGPRAAARTVLSVFAALNEHRLAMLIPVAVILFAASALLYFVNMVSPLAPFVYSLF